MLDGGGQLDGWIAAELRLSLEVGERVHITGLVVDGTVRRAGVGRRTLVVVAAAAGDSAGVTAVVVRSNV